MEKIVEICCGSYYDAKQAAAGGAKRIELNSALHMGGMTPTLSTLQLVKEELDLKVVAMVRPRGAGFCYREEEFQVMLAECEMLVSHGADGIAFGCLNPDASLNLEYNKRMLEIIKKYQKEAVFHRAFDCSREPFETMETLIELGVDRVLTSGLKPKAMEGAGLLKELQSRYGKQIEILAGSGINRSNARKLMEETLISQVHSSCKAWVEDPTTVVNGVSYSFAADPYEKSYDVVSEKLVRELIESIEIQESRS